MGTKYIRNEEHYTEVLQEMTKVNEQLLISTANLKDLYINEDECDDRSNLVPLLTKFEEMVKRGVIIKILCSRPSQNFIEELEQHPLLRPNKKGKHKFLYHVCPRIHMKLIICDRNLAYIGSANVTGAALGIRKSNSRNYEAGVLTTDEELVLAARNHFWEAWDNNVCSSCKKEKDCKYKRSE